MKAWLKGGLIGGGIGIVSSLIMFFESCYELFNCRVGKCGNPIFCIERNSIYLFYLIIIGFLLGAIIGLIVQKIKSRKS